MLISIKLSQTKRKSAGKYNCNDIIFAIIFLIKKYQTKPKIMNIYKK